MTGIPTIEKLRSIRKEVRADVLNSIAIKYSDMITRIILALTKKAEKEDFCLYEGKEFIIFASAELKTMPWDDINALIYYIEMYGYDVTMTCDDEASSLSIADGIQKTGDMKISWEM